MLESPKLGSGASRQYSSSLEYTQYQGDNIEIIPDIASTRLILTRIFLHQVWNPFFECPYRWWNYTEADFLYSLLPFQERGHKVYGWFLLYCQWSNLDISYIGPEKVPEFLIEEIFLAETPNFVGFEFIGRNHLVVEIGFIRINLIVEQETVILTQIWFFWHLV